MIASRLGNANSSHSNTLLNDIDEMIREAGITIDDVDVFAAAIGPGSFTGLRIGLATTKGLAATLGRPCTGIPTLQAVALGAGPSAATVAMLPAGRGEVFVQLLRVVADRVEPLDEAAHLSPEKVFRKYGSLERVLWAGEGALAQWGTINGWAQSRGSGVFEGWRLAPIEKNLARHVVSLAYQRGETVEPEMLRAIYVRPSDAELKVNAIK
jgi:tRNA threonylcarbamoyladenosine biosynthesis protein TsaB